jgi:putative hydrolases of HD superfamily
MDTKKFFNYLAFLKKFQQIERSIYAVEGSKRFENDMEHIGQLGSVCWYMIEAMKLKMDVGLVLKYVMAHDLIEVYSGDTDPYLSEEEYRNSKAEREEKAAKRMREEFSEFAEVNDMIEEYEHKATPEARFVYAVDKLLPIVNIFITGDDYYTRNKLTEEIWRNHNLPKMAKDPNLTAIIEDLVGFMKKERSDLFYQQS